MTQHASDTAGDMPPPIRATVEEAAKLLGVSENAVRKRIERGTLRSELVEGTRFVLLDGDMPRHADDTPPGMPGSDMSLLFEGMQEQIEWLRNEVERKDAIIMSLTQRIPELEPPREPREAPETVSEASGKGDVPPEPQAGLGERSSWWRRVFFGPSR